MSAPGKSLAPVDGPEFEKRIAHDYFVRFHMSVILAAVVASGVLSSKILMVLGFSLGIRYPFAVLASYCVFLLLVRIWIWYVSARCAAGFSLGNLNFGGRGGSGGSWGFGGGSGGGGFRGFGGGSSGGGGASSSWEGNEAAALIAQPSAAPSGGGGKWFPDIDLGGGDDNCIWVILLLAAVVLCILGGGIYLVWAAPHILPEAAAQALLAGTLTRVSKEEHHDWMAGVFKSTWIPFVVVMILAGALGWEAHRYCPSAHRLLDLLNCPGK